MESIGGILERIEAIRKKSSMFENTPESPAAEDTKPDCPICNDLEYIIEGWKARECVCAPQKQLQRRMKNAMIPSEFKDARLDNFEVKTEVQKRLYRATTDYLAMFHDIRNDPINGLGFLATMGEKTIHSIQDPAYRHELKKKHNSYGLGKTHLQIAVAKELIHQNVSVLVVSDVVLMEELAQARYRNDGGEEYNRKLQTVIEVPVLVWDDLGKSKESESNQRRYYHIINERNRHHRPIIFSTNEDEVTLEEKIGYAAASRLMGMTRIVVNVEGEDYRNRDL